MTFDPAAQKRDAAQRAADRQARKARRALADSLSETYTKPVPADVPAAEFAPAPTPHAPKPKRGWGSGE